MNFLLIEKCISGDQRSVRRLVATYRDLVFGLCYRMLGHRHDAEDATQETLVRVLRSLHRWDSGRALRPWILAIAANRCRSAMQKKAKVPCTFEIAEDYPEHRGDFFVAHQLSEEINLALQRLSPNHREAFLLFHQSGLSGEEIAAIMDRPLGTIKTWIHRARKELFSQLSKRNVLQEFGLAMQRI